MRRYRSSFLAYNPLAPSNFWGLTAGLIATQLTFLSPGNKTTTDNPFSLQASSTSPAPIAFSIEETSTNGQPIANIAPGVDGRGWLTLVGGVGTLKIIAEQMATASHTAARLEHTITVRLPTPTVGTRLVGGGFHAAGGTYTPPTLAWIEQNATTGRITLTDSSPEVVELKNFRYYDNDVPASAYDWNAPLETPVIRLNFSTYNPNRKIILDGAAIATRRPIITGNLRGGELIIRNSNFIGPTWLPGVYDRAIGQIVNVADASLTFENNYSTNNGGIYLASAISGLEVTVRLNRMENLNGLIPKTNGQVWHANRQYLQLNGLPQPRLLVEENWFSNNLNQDFYQEDALSFFNTPFDPAFPGIIRNNFFDTGGFSRSVRLVYLPNGVVQNGYSGTAGMSEHGTRFLQWYGNTILQYSAGFYSYATDILFESNTVVSTGRFEYGPEVGKIITCGNGAFACPEGGVSIRNVLRANRTAMFYHHRKSFEDAKLDPSMASDTIVPSQMGTMVSGNTIESHASWNSTNRTFESPPYWKRQNPAGSDYNGLGLADNALIELLRLEQLQLIAQQAEQGKRRAPAF